MTLHVEMDRLAGLGAILHGLAGEAQRLGPSAPSLLMQGVEPAVSEAVDVAQDVVDSALLTALKERLSETGEIMVNVANQYRNADDEALELATDTYTDATGDWLVPEVPR
jgi:hypothetical protein